MVVAGDFNARLGSFVPELQDQASNSRGRWLYKLLTEHGMHLLNGTCPRNNGQLTRDNPRGTGSTLDLMWLSEDLW